MGPEQLDKYATSPGVRKFAKKMVARKRRRFEKKSMLTDKEVGGKLSDTKHFTKGWSS